MMILVITCSLLFKSVWAVEASLAFVEGHTSVDGKEINNRVISNHSGSKIRRWVTPLTADEMEQLIVGRLIGKTCTADNASSSIANRINKNTMIVTSDKPYMVRGKRLVEGVKGKVCIRHPNFNKVNKEFRAGEHTTVTLVRR